jgi:hypothetical protein
MNWLKKLFPQRYWWFRLDYGPGIEGFIRQHVPAHVGGNGFLAYWVFVWAEVNEPWKITLIFPVVGWELLQRERWRRDTGGGNAMPIVENVWDIILGLAGIALAVWVHGMLA